MPLLEWILRPGYLLSMVRGEGVLAGAEVGVGEGRILYVARPGERPPELPYAPGLRRLEAPDAVLMPGFVNAHCHVAMTLLRGYADDLPLEPWLKERIWPVEERMTTEDIYWGALLGIAEMLRAGVTTFADMYLGMDAVARAVAESGIRAVLARGLVGTGADAAAKLEEGVQFCERWEGAAEGRIRTMLGPHAPYTCPPPFLREVMAEADRLGVGLHIHLAETAREVEAWRTQYGAPPVAWAEGFGLFERPVLAAHCVHLTDEEVAILARRQVGVAHNPLSNLKLASGIAPVAELLAAGATVGIGTDGAASTNQLGMFEEIRAAALLQKVRRQDPAVLPALEVLGLATRGGAAAVGLGGEVGQVAPGFAADLILVELRGPRLTPRHDVAALLAYSAQDADVRWVMVGGRVVVDEGRLRTIDEERVRAEVQARARRLAAGP